MQFICWQVRRLRAGSILSWKKKKKEGKKRKEKAISRVTYTLLVLFKITSSPFSLLYFLSFYVLSLLHYIPHFRRFNPSKGMHPSGTDSCKAQFSATPWLFYGAAAAKSGLIAHGTGHCGISFLLCTKRGFRKRVKSAYWLYNGLCHVSHCKRPHA